MSKSLAFIKFPDNPFRMTCSLLHKEWVVRMFGMSESDLLASAIESRAKQQLTVVGAEPVYQSTKPVVGSPYFDVKRFQTDSKYSEEASSHFIAFDARAI